MTGSSVKFLFPNRNGDILAGNLELPENKPVAFAIFAHCFAGNKNFSAASRISRGLRKYGIAILRFDFTGLGNSEGDFSNTNFSSNAEDLISAAEELERRYEAPKLIIGHSLGGAAALYAAHYIKSLTAVVTISAPSDPSHVAHLFQDSIDIIEKKGAHEVNLGGRKFTLKKQFLDDLKANQILTNLHNLDKALLICHSPTDDIVSIDHARKLYEAAVHPKSFISLEGADHLITTRDASDFLSAIINAWARRYVGAGYQ